MGGTGCGSHEQHVVRFIAVFNTKPVLMVPVQVPVQVLVQVQVPVQVPVQVEVPYKNIGKSLYVLTKHQVPISETSAPHTGVRNKSLQNPVSLATLVACLLWQTKHQVPISEKSAPHTSTVQGSVTKVCKTR